MEYFYLMNEYDKVLKFGFEVTELGNHYEICDVYLPDQLPLWIRDSFGSEALFDWVERRVIPVNRHHMEAVLGAINLENKFDVLRYSHAMSLNDTFWIQEENENLNYYEINLYDNKFDEALGWIAFTGLPSDISRHLSTPELTTGGALPKYWQKISFDDIILCKGGTEGYSNAGYEPFGEIVAYLISKRIKINNIPVSFEFRNKKPVSVTKLFTSRKFGLLSANQYLIYNFPKYKYVSLERMLEAMEKDLPSVKPFYDMCFFDYLIENGDRHLNNWGFLVNNKTMRIDSFAPLWDNGASLMFDNSEMYHNEFDFASFSIRYDFVKTCEYKEEYISLCRRLVASVNSGELAAECSDMLKDYTPYRNRVQPALEFVKSRCEEYIKCAESGVLRLKK